MLIFKVRTVKFWEYLVYIIGLSVAFIMFAGLIVNWTLPWLHITDKPLSLVPILVSFDIFLLVMWFFAVIRNFELPPFEIKTPKLDRTNQIFFIIPMIFPVLSILGALILNNHGPNILTMIMLGGIALYVFFLVLKREKLNENVYPWAILMISISLLLMYSLRSWFISGVDINLEFSVFNSTSSLSYWSPSNYDHVYNAMLSLTVFPTVISSFLGLNKLYLIKIFLEIIFPLVPLTIYLFSKKFIKSEFSFMGAFFFISQPMFILGYFGIPLRQQIAFLFFGLMLLVLFTKEIGRNMKSLLFAIFGFSMIVSHYSTAYIALAIFLLSYILILIYKGHEHRKIRKGKLHPHERTEFHLTGFLVILLLIFSFLWYTQVTDTADGLIDFTKKSFSNLGNIFNEDVQSQTQTPLSHFNIFNKNSENKPFNVIAYEAIDDYNKKYPNLNRYPNETYSDYQIKPKTTSSLIMPIKSSILTTILEKRELVKIIGEIILFIGILYFLIKQFFNKKKATAEFGIHILVSLIFLLTLIVLPFSSVSYDLGRVYQQVLLILSPLILFGGFLILKYKKGVIVVSLFVILYFLFLSSFNQQFLGGSDVSLNLNNVGSEYDSIYSSSSEINSGIWLFNHYGGGLIYLDNLAYYKLAISSSPSFITKSVRGIFPQIITQDGYVYLGRSNTQLSLISKTYGKYSILYESPSTFLNNNKGKIYSNGESEIFK